MDPSIFEVLISILVNLVAVAVLSVCVRALKLSHNSIERLRVERRRREDGAAILRLGSRVEPVVRDAARGEEFHLEPEAVLPALGVRIEPLTGGKLAFLCRLLQSVSQNRGGILDETISFEEWLFDS